LINFVVHVIFIKLELQVLKVSPFSIGWFALTVHLVRTNLPAPTDCHISGNIQSPVILLSAASSYNPINGT